MVDNFHRFVSAVSSFSGGQIRVHDLTTTRRFSLNPELDLTLLLLISLVSFPLVSFDWGMQQIRDRRLNLVRACAVGIMNTCCLFQDHQDMKPVVPVIAWEVMTTALKS